MRREKISKRGLCVSRTQQGGAALLGLDLAPSSLIMALTSSADRNWASCVQLATSRVTDGNGKHVCHCCRKQFVLLMNGVRLDQKRCRSLILEPCITCADRSVRAPSPNHFEPGNGRKGEGPCYRTSRKMVGSVVRRQGARVARVASTTCRRRPCNLRRRSTGGRASVFDVAKLSPRVVAVRFGTLYILPCTATSSSLGFAHK